MKMYLVGIRKKSKVARLAAYETYDLADNRKSGVGLSYRDILGGYDYEPAFQSQNKQECIDYMNQKLRTNGWGCYDHSNKTVKLESGKKMYAVVGNWAAGTIDGIMEYHSGNPKLRLPNGYSQVLFESSRKADCVKYINQFYRNMEKAKITLHLYNEDNTPQQIAKQLVKATNQSLKMHGINDLRVLGRKSKWEQR